MSDTPCRGIFVTGTDTGVGKTRVAAELLAYLCASGVDAVPMKPVQTGCVSRKGAWVAPDLMQCLRHAGIKPDPAELPAMAPYRFRPAWSPHFAAEQAGVRISLPVMVRAFRRLSRAHECVVVEGAGGIMVPLNLKQTMLDLMVSLALPVIVVARPGLGTLNHTLSSLQILRQAKLHVLGVVVNQSTPGRWGVIEKNNLRTLETLGGVETVAMKYQA